MFQVFCVQMRRVLIIILSKVCGMWHRIPTKTASGFEKHWRNACPVWTEQCNQGLLSTSDWQMCYNWVNIIPSLCLLLNMAAKREDWVLLWDKLLSERKDEILCLGTTMTIIWSLDYLASFWFALCRSRV